MKIILNSIKYTILLLMLSLVSHAQPGPPGDPVEGDPYGNPVPITGLEILLVAGAALGIKRISDLKKKN